LVLPNKFTLAFFRHWLTERDDKVDAKGKGKMTTFWCEPNGASASVFSGNETIQSGDCADDAVGQIGLPEDKIQHLVEWNATLFTGLLEELVRSRDCNKEIGCNESALKNVSALQGNPVDEVQEEIILVPKSKAFTQAPTDCQLRTLLSRGHVDKENAQPHRGPRKGHEAQESNQGQLHLWNYIESPPSVCHSVCGTDP
jgi:hypothetical protein